MPTFGRISYDNSINVQGNASQTMNLALDFGLNDALLDVGQSFAIGIGGTSNVAGLNPLIGGQLSINRNDNDVESILDAELGIAGADVAGADLSVSAFGEVTIELTNNVGTTDFINVSGRFVEDYILENANNPGLAGAFGGFVNLGNGKVEVAARNYQTPATDGQIFLGANNNTSDVAADSNELRQLVGAFLNDEAEAQGVLDALIDADGSRFELGKRGTHTNTFLAEFEADRIVLEIQNQGTNAQNKAGVVTYDKLILVGDWDGYLGPDFAATKTAYDAFDFMA